MSKLFLSLTLFLFLGNLYAQSYWKEDKFIQLKTTNTTLWTSRLFQELYIRILLTPEIIIQS